MKVLIVGGGKVGSHLATLLLAGLHQVAIIEQRPEVLARLQHDLPKARLHLGSGTDPLLLEAAGIQQTDVVAAVTGQDETNIVVATLARFAFNAARVIARVNNPKNAWMFTPPMGVDVALNQADIMAHLIAEEMSVGDMMTLLKLTKGQYSLVEERVAATAPAAGKALRDLPLPPECSLAAVIRRGHLLLPRAELVLEPDDEVLAVVHVDQTPALAALLSTATDQPP
ncbi:MAG: TrkA family potassium uptake protein [Caldilinea sp. CFX5]|nr:TrkA family potassium uptake protein [Caldilinea sp. CFX5]